MHRPRQEHVSSGMGNVIDINRKYEISSDQTVCGARTALPAWAVFPV